MLAFMSPICSNPQANPIPTYRYLDGGTIGLSLLPEIEDADAVIIVDASEIGEQPGHHAGIP